ncbi:hypothetical protein AXG53_19055 [Stenotrophomonas sp. KCTC 12332]|nr:hypothetical protein AXG53_19055 [Stenotrophomonas sp. KCTC 12332]
MSNGLRMAFVGSEKLKSICNFIVYRYPLVDPIQCFLNPALGWPIDSSHDYGFWRDMLIKF